MEDKIQHFVGKVAQKAIIATEGKILICRGIGDKVWELPGGRLHAGESPQEGLAREVLEELNLVIAVEKPVYLCRSFHFKDNNHQIFVAYRCPVISGEIKADRSEVEDMRWVSEKEAFEMPLFDDCRDALKAYFGVR